jgi:hypothetical protein
MSESWKEVRDALQQETRRIALSCPDEIKRFHYGIITHSDAGKRSYNQYLGHYVHLYAWYMVYGGNILGLIGELAHDSRYSLDHVKDVFLRTVPGREMTGYSGQTPMADWSERIVAALPTVQTKEEFAELLAAWAAYVGRRYWWIHWYFPWGAGAAICRRLSREDIKEMIRLVETTPQ